MALEPHPDNSEWRRCTNCGTELPAGANFCGSCGAPYQETPPDGFSRVPPPRLVNLEYMGFWIRFVSITVDYLVILIMIVLLTRFFGPMGALGGYILSALYFVLLTSLQGQTLGKMLLGLKVVDSRGNVPGLGTTLIREVVGRFAAGLVFNLGYAWAGWDTEKRGWHDHIAGTHVVRKERERVY